MNLVDRVRNILVSPRTEWPVIERESASIGSIYTEYVMILAAIPAVAGFVGMSLFGVGAFGVTMRVPLLSGLVQMVLSYGLSLAMVYALGMIINALAPSFDGTKDELKAFKVAAYSLTASMVAGIFSLFPALAILGLVGAAWSIWLLYLGLPALMKAPQDKAAIYTVVVVVAGIVLGMLVGVVLALFTPSM